METLKAATTDELLSELETRFDAILVIAERPQSPDSPEPVLMMAEGTKTLLLGLGVRMDIYLNDLANSVQYNEISMPGEDDDDGDLY